MKIGNFLAALAVPLLAAFTLGAAADVPLDAFKALPIMDGGRVKPLDTYARATLLQLSSKSSYHGKPAIAWLAKLMFDPRGAVDDKVFRINNPEVAYSLGIEPQSDSRYAFAQLGPAIDKLFELAEAASRVDEKQRTPVESELLRVANNMNLYVADMNAFSFCFPSPEFRVDTATARALGLEAKTGPYSYMDLRSHMGAIGMMVRPLMGGEGGPGGGPFAGPSGGHGKDPASWTPAEQEAMRLFQTFANWSEHYRQYVFPLVPPGEGREEMWQSPWDLVSRPNMDSAYRAAVADLGTMGRSYAAGRPDEFNQAVIRFAGFVAARNHGASKENSRNLELFYNALAPFYLAKILYGFAILASLIAIMAMRRWTYWPGVALLAAGVAVHATGIGLRVAIGGRAPITNLFETFLFVACVGAMLGLALEFYNRKAFGILVGSITGFLVLMLSGRYDTDGDTIGVLVAVLNSNFWLSTHVVTISLGYAGFCMAGVLGHLFIIQKIVNDLNQEKLDALTRMTYGVLAFGLIFALIGTVLGGVWADQSWGRFWGWDPKENGALMIVLWGILLFHAKPARLIEDLGMAVGSVLGIIVVMMAWFGINLLGVGLHSYGFTSGVATALSTYVALETVFLAGSLYLIKRKEINQRLLSHPS
ncbi:MAG: cytochrome c biogenesis protein CcsA [Fibrobacteres bacterium]|nr:cytochrome c biogenesis protein CcsA [Fibrobacterota bacterium]